MPTCISALSWVQSAKHLLQHKKKMAQTKALQRNEAHILHPYTHVCISLTVLNKQKGQYGCILYWSAVLPDDS
jgi:hypothetical protein